MMTLFTRSHLQWNRWDASAWLGFYCSLRASLCLGLLLLMHIEAVLCCVCECVCFCICISGAQLARCAAPPAPYSPPSLLTTCSCCLPSRHKVLNCNAWTSAVCVRWGHASRGVSPLSLLSLSPPPSTVQLTLPSETCLTGFGSVYFRQSKRVGGGKGGRKR